MAKNTNVITTVPTAKAAASADNRDFLKEIREIVKGMHQDDAFWNTTDFLSKEEGGLRWLLAIKEKCNGNLIVNKHFEFDASDMIKSVVKRRLTALEKAIDINLEDVLQELESTAWCCRLS